jgi:outer membrane protein assembly factor BamB
MDLDGKVLWSSTSTHKFGIGPYMLVDGRILVMNDHGKLTMVEGTPKGFNLIAEAKVLDGHDSWAPMALAGKLLIVRDLTMMACLDLEEK